MAISLRDRVPVTSTSLQPLPTAASQRPAGVGIFRNTKLSQSSSSTPCHPAATEDGAGAKEAKPSEAAGECFAMLRLAQLRTPLAALSWSKKGSIAPRPHGQKSLMVKPQRAAASQPSSLAATPLPAGAWSQCQSRREQGMFPMVIPINKPTAIHVQRLHSFH